MLGHDSKGATAAAMEVQDNSELMARIEDGTLADPDAGGVAVMDVMFSNITDQTWPSGAGRCVDRDVMDRPGAV